MYLVYNKNILEYGEIARYGTESMIPDTEGCSTISHNDHDFPTNQDFRKT